ncbi:hypothetical protein J2J97_32440 (plasmid) [Rhizobium bangladeshense]|uniref:hypothetical protein n=1 Tax=Rhizobium bangladeshense TaxID=1138189 RepID=UPI001A987980|nr:hypothetical protein [Rhizobium bangladeshense]QSY98615.1 hypothetical protein J2J97_32440 [Rhizobium bangladeshense]
MGYLQQIEGDSAMLIEKGVYKPADLYKMDDYLFAKVGSGFVRIDANGGTSKASARVHKLMYEGPLYKDSLGRLCVAPGEKRTALESNVQQKLLGIAGPEE